MSKKKHKPHATSGEPVDLRPRIDRARAEGRYQQALELAKQLHKYEPTPAHKTLLLETYFGRAQQLRTAGQVRDAVTVLDVAIALDGVGPDFLSRAASEYARCGAADKALALTNRLPADGPERARIFAHAADAAIQAGPPGRATLSADLQPDFDRILQASAQVAAGQDDAALETLQPVGLRSPFLEWKLFLRGLSAFYRRDDARALENWTRLNGERLPARLAAPYRFGIDTGFAAAQPPAAQAALRGLAERFEGPNLSQQLRHLQKALANTDSLMNAFRLIEGLLPQARVAEPTLIPRLAACFYWAVVDHGQPADMGRIRRTFGAPRDDAEFYRLQALVHERLGDMAGAHRHWQDYEKWVAAHPEAWPGDPVPLVRALVWRRMGLNAASMPDFDKLDEMPLPPFLLNHPDRPRPLKPDAATCFAKSLELAPEQLETHDDLVRIFLDANDGKKAEKAARALLERFPDHVPTLQRLARLRSEAQDYAETITLLERALRLNPLDSALRRELSSAHLFQARAFVEAGRFDDARTRFATALALDRQESPSVLCKMAACEFKANDPTKAEEYLGRAFAAGSRLGVAFSMLIEVIRLKLAGKLKTRFNKEFNDLLGKPPEAAAAVGIAVTAAAHKLAGVTYHGQKTHEKKVLDYLKKCDRLDYAEGDLDDLCKALIDLEAPTHLIGQLTHLGRQRYPKNPKFPLWEIENCFKAGPHRCPPYRIHPLLEEVRRLAAAMPPGSEREKLLEQVREHEEMLAAASPFGRLGGLGGILNIFGGASPFGDPYGGDDDYDD